MECTRHGSFTVSQSLFQGVEDLRASTAPSPFPFPLILVTSFYAVGVTSLPLARCHDGADGPVTFWQIQEALGAGQHVFELLDRKPNVSVSGPVSPREDLRVSFQAFSGSASTSDAELAFPHVKGRLCEFMFPPSL